MTNSSNITVGSNGLLNDDTSRMDIGTNTIRIISSARVISAEDRVDPAGSYYTAYVMQVETTHPKEEEEEDSASTSTTILVEHRYSEFARLHAELSANDIHLRSSFPTKSLYGRIGNWLPAVHWAPEKMAELVTYRKIKLDLWIVELTELLARAEDAGIPTGELREMCREFFQKPVGCPPCDRANPVNWNGLAKDSSSSSSKTSETCIPSLVDENEDISPNQKSMIRHSPENLLSNPISFTMGSEIRKATYTIAQMCGSSALAADRSIPLDLLQQAKGLCFLTVLKIGCVVSGRVGTGIIVARRENGNWSPPSAIGTFGMGYGPQIGGDITSYIIVLTTLKAVAAFASRGTLNLGAELGVAVGPVGRSAMGNLNAGDTGIAAAYCYAHSKGFFVGISLEGSVLASRSDVNAKFYGRQVDAYNLLFESSHWTPRAAQPLYDALKEASETEIRGFRPSHIGKVDLKCSNVGTCGTSANFSESLCNPQA